MIQKSLFTLLLMLIALHNATPSAGSDQQEEEKEVIRDQMQPPGIEAPKAEDNPRIKAIREGASTTPPAEDARPEARPHFIPREPRYPDNSVGR